MTTNALTVQVASGDALDVREFTVEEGLSRLFDVRLTAMSASVDVDFEGAIGGPARFEVLRTSAVDGETRYWNGICAGIEQTEAEADGLSTYTVRIVPVLWLLTQRRNYRIFQDQSELDIVLQVLQGWGIQPTLLLDAGSYPKRRIRVQYAETDFDFVNRLLEDIGVTYYFEQTGGDTALVLADCPNKGSARAPVAFVDKPNARVGDDYVTAVRTGRHVRPGRYTQSDVDYRKALNYPLASSAAQGNAVESQLERYHHNYGSFLWKTAGGGDTPHADDRGAARSDERAGATQVAKRLDAQRIDARVCSFHTVAHDLRPGKVFTISGHPRAELASPLLIASSTFSGVAQGDWTHTCEARYTDVDYRPPLRTPKPRTLGVESATVTGPAGEEIHTDEFGRVRVHFHWDREGASDETSSCWVPQSQPWAGAGFGATSLARVGQEVLVDFLGADPDRPVVVGRVFTTTTPPPYQLPRYKMVSGHRSESYPRPKSGRAQARLGGGPVEMGEPPAGPAGGGLPLGRLGTSDPSPSAPVGGPPPTQDLPGTRGNAPVSSSQLGSTIKSNDSAGPDDSDHTRSANGLVHDDSAGKEMMYLQAERNFYQTVKVDSVTNVGASQVCNVGKNDTKSVGAYETTQVIKDRVVVVGGTQTHVVTGDITDQGMANRLVVTDNNHTTRTTNGGQALFAKTGIFLSVGDKSTILMTPASIVINAPKVYINPGDDFMNVVYATGDTEAAEKAAKKAAADRAAQIAANEKKIKDLQYYKANLVGEHGINNWVSDKLGMKPDWSEGEINNTQSSIDSLQAQNAQLAAKN